MKSLQTDGQTDGRTDGQQVIRKAHLSFQLGELKKKRHEAGIVFTKINVMSYMFYDKKKIKVVQLFLSHIIIKDMKYA